MSFKRGIEKETQNERKRKIKGQKEIPKQKDRKNIKNIKRWIEREIEID